MKAYCHVCFGVPKFCVCRRLVHKYPYDWRSKQPVINRATNQVFLPFQQGIDDTDTSKIMCIQNVLMYTFKMCSCTHSKCAHVHIQNVLMYTFKICAYTFCVVLTTTVKVQKFHKLVVFQGISCTKFSHL